MSIGNNSIKVISRYFTGHTVMDESLSDFQVKKKITAQTKPQKPSTSKTRTKKTVKRVKGQKDIRQALRCKKNELVAYSNDFDNVCRQSGIDVDSEQLQLAIALSRSLHTEDHTDNSQNINGLSSQERTNKIRTTLLEYGFKVPEIKIILPHKKTKRHTKKNHKLLLTTEAEKKQIISHKYSQILFENCNNITFTENPHESDRNKIFDKATNENYNKLKYDEVFYVDGLIEKTSKGLGCLLKDWSSIPGRPVSPGLNKKEAMNVSEIDCSQVELDTILSGSLKSIRDIIEKYKSQSNKTRATSSMSTNLHNIIGLENNKVYKNESIMKQKLNTNANNFKHISPSSETESFQDSNKTRTVNNLGCPRSLSPDMFDDEESLVIQIEEYKNQPQLEGDKTLNGVSIVSEITHNQSNTAQESKFMDLTECANVPLNSFRDVDQSVVLSQQIDKTERKSNDFMEITECVANFSESVQYKPTNIDLTQCSDSGDGYNSEQVGNVINVDTEATIVLVNVDNKNMESSTSEDDLPNVTISGQDKEDSVNDTIILNENEYIEENTTFKNKEKKECNLSNNHIIDLSGEYSSNTPYTSFYDEYIHDHSHENHSKCSQHEFLENSNNKPENSIDLTQSSYSSEDNEKENKNNLGKKDDVSIDYDDVDNNESKECHKSQVFDLTEENNIEQINITPNSDNNRKSEVLSSEKVMIVDINDDSISDHEPSLSQNSEPFEICDNELDYSLHKSKLEKQENFGFGGISILDDLSNVRFSKSTDNVSNRSMSDSFLPMVDIKKLPDISNVKRNAGAFTPVKNNHDLIVAQTPKNSEYIVKTDNVTPMLNYAEMSTPDVNKELDKYGLKAFKRKRAIQLLTHIYSQTHPTIETYQEDLPLPSKKLKSTSTEERIISPRKPSKSPQKQLLTPKKLLKSPMKPSKSPRKRTRIDIDTEKENGMYEVTEELPDIQNIECCEEDWVFQKREKAKVQSCRVPLHIVFHNYMCCRRLLREAILRYEPVNIDVIHKGLVAEGYRYDPKELLKFMDRKCITVKTSDDSRNSKKL